MLRKSLFKELKNEFDKYLAFKFFTYLYDLSSNDHNYPQSVKAMKRESYPEKLVESISSRRKRNAIEMLHLFEDILFYSSRTAKSEFRAILGLNYKIKREFHNFEYLAVSGKNRLSVVITDIVYRIAKVENIIECNRIRERNNIFKAKVVEDE